MIQTILDSHLNCIASHVEVPSTQLGKMRGLLPYKEVPPDFAMVFEDIKQIHMFFMRTAIDVMYLDEQKQVLHVGTIKPWRFGPYKRKAKWVIESRVGTFAHIRRGDLIHFSEEDLRERGDSIEKSTRIL